MEDADERLRIAIDLVPEAGRERLRSLGAARLAELLNDRGYDLASLPTDRDELYALVTALAFFDDTAEKCPPLLPTL